MCIYTQGNCIFYHVLLKKKKEIIGYRQRDCIKIRCTEFVWNLSSSNPVYTIKTRPLVCFIQRLCFIKQYYYKCPGQHYFTHSIISSELYIILSCLISVCLHVNVLFLPAVHCVLTCITTQSNYFVHYDVI